MSFRLCHPNLAHCYLLSVMPTSTTGAGPPDSLSIPSSWAVERSPTAMARTVGLRHDGLLAGRGNRTWKDTGGLLVLTLEARRSMIDDPARAGAAHAYVAPVNKT